MIDTRYQLASERIRQIAAGEDLVHPAFRDYFRSSSGWIVMLLDRMERGREGLAFQPSEEVLAREDRALWRGLLPEGYGTSYLNPSFAADRLGRGHGPMLSALLAELYALPRLAAGGSRERILIRMELFLEIWQVFSSAFREPEGTGRPRVRHVRDRISMALGDYARDEAAWDLAEKWTRQESPLRRLLMEEDPEDPRALYLLGVPVTDRERALRESFLSLGKTELETAAGAAADRVLKALRGGPEECAVTLSWDAGSGRLVRRAAEILEKEGLVCGFSAAGRSLFLPGNRETGCRGGAPDPRFAAGHAGDQALFSGEILRSRQREGLREALKEAAGGRIRAGEADFKKLALGLLCVYD